MARIKALQAMLAGVSAHATRRRGCSTRSQLAHDWSLSAAALRAAGPSCSRGRGGVRSERSWSALQGIERVRGAQRCSDWTETDSLLVSVVCTAQQYKEEDNDAWREEQERIWEAEQAALREAAAKEKAALESGAAAAAPASAAAGASTAATPAAFSSAAPALPAQPASGPHQWSTPELAAWLRNTVSPLVLRRSEIFASKGWSTEEVSKWRAEITAGFASAATKVEGAKITGSRAAGWDLSSDKPWGEHLGITNQYIRAAVWASWKQELRQWQEAQNGKK